MYNRGKVGMFFSIGWGRRMTSKQICQQDENNYK